MTLPESPLTGGCDCRQVRYRIESPPLFVHCCHCRWCQRETGASFALNALIESNRVEVLGVAAGSHRHAFGTVARARRSRAVRSADRGLGAATAGRVRSIGFIRVGTLDEPDRLPPDIHIFTESKQPWVVLPSGAAAVPQYYDRKKHWPAASLERFEAVLAKLKVQ